MRLLYVKQKNKIMNRKMIEMFVGSIISAAIVVALTIILTKTEMNCRTLLIAVICVFVGAGLNTGMKYLIDRKTHK